MRIVVAALLPMGLFAGVLFYFLWETQQAQRNQEQIARVRTMAAVIESELDNVVGRLQVLASDPLLNSQTLREFDRRSRDLLAANTDWENILLLSPEKQLVNAAMPYGVSLPVRRPVDYQEKAFATKKATVSDLFMSRMRGTEAISVAVPVIRDDRPAYLLLAGMKREHLSEVLRNMVPPGGVASVYDRNFRIVARSRDLDPNLGTLPGAGLLEAMRGQREGVTRTRTREGVSVFTTWTTLSNGWSIATGTPSAAADSALARYAGLLGATWLAVLAAGLIMAGLLLRRIDRSIATTTAIATRLAAGEAAEFPAENVRELASLAETVTRLFMREREARAESDAANAAKDEFLAMLGHELRNPIGAIANAVYIMDGDARTPADDLLARRVIVRQTENLRRLIDDLLDIGRVLAGKIALDRHAIDFALCVTRAMESLAAAGRTARHDIKVDAVHVWVKGDATRLEQVLTNLVVNALNHTPASGNIRVRLANESGHAVLTVSDTGVGIGPASLSRVFELFYQEAKQDDRPRGGLGIGLTLARRLVELHDGVIAVASAGTGKGATFTVRIPACAPPASSTRPAPTERARARKKILIVEDNMDARETLRAALELSGHEVQAAVDGPGGLERLSTFTPDAVIIDIGLPVMDGYAVARAIRTRNGDAVRLIALTGYGLPEDEQKAAAAGFDAHLVKPADLARLAALLEGDSAQVLTI